MATRNISDCTPLLQEFFPKLREAYCKAYPGRGLLITCAYRSPEEQAAIFAKNAPGAVLTRCDGVKKKSNHNYKPSRAFDLAVIENGKAQWDEEYYKPLGPMIAALGYDGKVRWGGWFTFHDYPHFEEICPVDQKI